MADKMQPIDPEEFARAQRMLAGGAVLLSAAAATPAEHTATDIEKLVNSGVENVDHLLAEARERLALAPAPKVTNDQREAPNADVVNALLAKSAELKRTIDSATKERGKITDLLAEITGPIPKKLDKLELTVNKAPVFVVTQVVSRVLNTDYIKSAHPDIEGNEAYYKDSVTTRRTYK